MHTYKLRVHNVNVSRSVLTTECSNLTRDKDVVDVLSPCSDMYIVIIRMPFLPIHAQDKSET